MLTCGVVPRRLFGDLSRKRVLRFVQIGAPVLMAPSRLLGRRSEGRCGTNPPEQERIHSGRDSG
jgi:hypothetical protein